MCRTLGPTGPIAGIAVGTALGECFETNALAPMRWIGRLMPFLERASAGGRIVYVSSGIVAQPNATFAAYCATKGAMDMFMGMLGQEGRRRSPPSRVTALSLVPGTVDTAMLRDYLSIAYHPSTPAALDARMHAMRASGTIVQPEAVAQAITRLVLRAPLAKSGQLVEWNEEWIPRLSIEPSSSGSA